MDEEDILTQALVMVVARLGPIASVIYVADAIDAIAGELNDSRSIYPIVKEMTDALRAAVVPLREAVAEA